MSNFVKPGLGMLQIDNEDILRETLLLLSELPHPVILNTARVYGDSEELIGKFLKEYSTSKFQIITKVGINFDPEHPFINDPIQLTKDIEECFTRLGVTKLYGLMLHRIDPTLSEEKISEIYQVLVDYKQAGKVSMIGVSEPKLKILEYLVSKYKVDCIEVACSPFNKLHPKINDIVNNNGIQIFAYTSALRGFLNVNVMKYWDDERGFLKDDFNNMLPTELKQDLIKTLRLSNEEATVGFYNLDVLKVNLKVVCKFVTLANKLNISPVILSLSYLASKGIICIPGTTKPERAKYNIEMCRFLDAEIMDMIDSITSDFSGSPNPACLSFLD